MLERTEEWSHFSINIHLFMNGFTASFMISVPACNRLVM